MAREVLKGGSPNYIPIPDGLELSAEALFGKIEIPLEEEEEEFQLEIHVVTSVLAKMEADFVW